MTDSFKTRENTHNALHLRDWLIAEAERADKANHLWADFSFALKKMGFCRAELTIGGEQRSIYSPDLPHEDLSLLWSEAHQIGEDTSLVLNAEKDRFSEIQFGIMSDLAAEAWSKASARWKEINKEKLSFDAQVREAPDCQQQ